MCVCGLAGKVETARGNACTSKKIATKWAGFMSNNSHEMVQIGKNATKAKAVHVQLQLTNACQATG